MIVRDLDDARKAVKAVVEEVSKVIIGKRDVIEVIVCTLFAEGHVLIEGPPGTGKTLMAKSLAKAIGGVFKRVQGHPDITPSDIFGFTLYTPSGEGRFVPGPIFTNVLFVDELNRMPTRVQAALLEAMEERQVSIDGVTRPLPRPFMVIATQIPFTMAQGVYAITETLIDRFYAKIPSSYSRPEEEFEIVKRADELSVDHVSTVISLDDAAKIIELCRSVYVSDRVVKYIVDIVNYLRNHEAVEWGPSHRASIAMRKIARVYALLMGRDYVIPDDIKRIAMFTLIHRVRLNPDFEVQGIRVEDLVREALDRVKVPKE